MSDSVLVPEGPQLSQLERVGNVFVAPTKTFTDILRSSSWWLPFLLMVLVSVVFNVAVDKKVGFEQITQQQMEKNKMMADRMEQMTPAQRTVIYQQAVPRTRISTFLSPIFILIFGLIASLLYWATVNFGFGGSTKFSQIFAVWIYAGLPKAFIYLLATVLLFAGTSTDNFDINNPVGTNVGYFMADASPAIKMALSFIDIFGLWALVLAGLGIATVARKSFTTGMTVVVIWWLFGLLLAVGVTAAFS